MFASKDTLLTRPSGGYSIARSVRLRSSASAYLNRTPASAGNQQKFTWSGWLKFGALGSNVTLFSTGVSPAARFQIGTASNGLAVSYNDGSSWVLDVTTNAVYRDPSAWYHVVVSVDTTQATSTNRVLVYVNSASSLYTGTNSPLNLNTNVNTAVSHSIGRLGNGTAFFDGYLTEVNFIDGQALTPSSFGSTNATTGVWQPAKYTGTYGTNGFYLNFSDNSAATAAAIGKDYSGNGNNWTPNNISVTAGVTYDSMTDVPTLTSATAANYATLNPINGNGTFANGNLQNNASSANWMSVATTQAFDASENRYCEVTIVSNNSVSNGIHLGIIGSAQALSGNTSALGTYATGYSWQSYLSGSNNKFNNSTGASYNSGATYTTNDIIGISLNNGTLTFYKNGTSQGSAYTGITGSFCFGGSPYNGDTIAWNFGQRPFSYTPPTGFVALNTYNLPTSTIVKGNTVMDATIWTGDGTTPKAVVSNLAFQPDFLWLKQRSIVNYHFLQNVITGATNYLASNATDAETSGSSGGWIQSFNSNGYTTVTGSSNSDNVNGSGITYVGWSWKAGGTGSSNTNGSITSTVSVNATAGFSVVTYTGNGTSGATVGHGLGVAPKMIIIKGRNTGYNWRVYHAGVGNTGSLFLNTVAASDFSSTYWNNTTPTTTVFSVGSNAGMNESAETYVAYCWSEVAGFSKFGSYTANASADGPFIYCGFRPKFVMVKRSSAAGAPWSMFDTSRNTYNATTLELDANSSGTEYTAGNGMDILSNGFKLRDSAYLNSSSGDTFIFAAFAENPLKNALAR